MTLGMNIILMRFTKVVYGIRIECAGTGLATKTKRTRDAGHFPRIPLP